MSTQSKLAILELIGGILGWVWIIASLSALCFLFAALFFDGAWSSFVWALATGVFATGFVDSQQRAAGTASGQFADAQRILNSYGAVLQAAAPLDTENKLPAPRDKIKEALIFAARTTLTAGHDIEQLRVGYGSLANFVPAGEPTTTIDAERRHDEAFKLLMREFDAAVSSRNAT
jgi:hypothetical protein